MKGRLPGDAGGGIRGEDHPRRSGPRGKGRESPGHIPRASARGWRHDAPGARAPAFTLKAAGYVVLGISPGTVPAFRTVEAPCFAPPNANYALPSCGFAARIICGAGPADRGGRYFSKRAEPCFQTFQS